MPFLSLVTLIFDLDLSNPSERGTKHVFHMNLAHIRSAVPEIFYSQTKNHRLTAQKNRTFHSSLCAGNSITVFSGLQVAPEYKLHPLFLPKIWEKFIDKSHLSISRTLFCYFLACRYVLGCIHVMRRSAKERQDAIDVVQKTLHAGLIVWAKVCSDAVI